jgi:hypothetical protein
VKCSVFEQLDLLVFGLVSISTSMEQRSALCRARLVETYKEARGPCVLDDARVGIIVMIISIG